MFFNGAVQRRLAALLQPWLMGDQELELKLGLLRSNGFLSNVRFNAAVLNGLLDDPSRICFKGATVEHVSLEFSPFSPVAFTLVVRGVSIILSIGEEEDEGGGKWRRKPRDTTIEERNKALEEIDPEGCALHDSIKKISEITTRRWRESLLDTVFRHCHLDLQDVHVLLQSPCLHDSLSCSLYTEKLRFASRIIRPRCFIRGLISSLLVPIEESMFDVDINSFEIRFNSESRTSSVLPATNMSAIVNSNHLQCTGLCFHVPALNILFSPFDLSVILLLYGLLSKERKCPRTGRQLWNIVASRINSLLPSSSLSLVKVVKIVSLWLHYVQTYQSILLRVGYPASERMQRSATLMFQDAAYSRSVKSQWHLIAEIEDSLPMEAVAVARRIIRHRGSLGITVENHNSGEVPATWPLAKLFQLRVLILSMISSLLVSVVKFFFLHKLAFFPESSSHSGSVHEISILQQSITLKIQEISVSVSPETDVQPSKSGNAFSEKKIPFQHTQAFNFYLDAFLLRYIVDISEKCVTLSCGHVKIFSCALRTGASRHSREHWKQEVDNRQIIVWVEPAQVINIPESTIGSAKDGNVRTSVPHLYHLLGKLWLNWKDSYYESEGENTPSLQLPWILIDIRSYLVDNVIRDSSSRVNCGLVVGKLNANLGYYSFVSIAALLRQLQCACWNLGSKNVVGHTPTMIIEDPPVRYFSKFAQHISQVQAGIIKMLPEKRIQLGAFVAGPHVLISPSNDQFNSDHLNTQISFEICNVELLVSPNLNDIVRLFGENSDCLGLNKPQEFDISESDFGAYSCQGQIAINSYLKINGLKAYIGDTIGNHKHEIISLESKTAVLNYVRKDHHSFGSSVVTVSAAFRFMSAGVSFLFFLDELYVLSKIVFEVLEESRAFIVDGSVGNQRYKELSRSGIEYSEFDCGPASFVRSRQSSLTNYLVYVNSDFELNSFDMILHHSRKTFSQETYRSIMSNEGEIDRKLGIYVSLQRVVMEFVFNGWDLDIIIDQTGARCLIFRYLTEYDGTLCESELENLLRSLSYLTEASACYGKLCFNFRNSEKAPPLGSLHRPANESSFHGETLYMQEDSSLFVSTETSSDRWLSANIVLSGICIIGPQMKGNLVDKLEEFSASCSVGGEFQAISCECKGGFVLVEAAAVTMFVESFTSYYQKISDFWPSGLSSCKDAVSQYVTEMVPLDNDLSANPQQVQCPEVTWDRLQAFSMILFHLSLILMERDESGRRHELLCEVNFHVSFELLDTVRKLSATISKFSMLSRFIHKAKHDIQPDVSDSGPSTSVSHRGSHVGISMSDPVQKREYISPQKYILKDLRCSLAVEGTVTEDQTTLAYLNNIWVGSGSLSGLDMTISLYEIKMVLSAFESFSKISNREGTINVESRHWSHNQEAGGNLREMVPDGIIVAIQDVDQHMYIAVGGAENGLGVEGAIHYSLAGERALFRVKYHKPRRWEPQNQYFSLVSLYGKDNSGEPLQLCCRPRSRFVDLSSPSDRGAALWRMLPFTPDAYEDAIELESSSSLSKRTFHLVNKKNNCAIAFNDGILEFVSKPGNLFKWKVFDGHAPEGVNLSLNRYLIEGFSSHTFGSRELQSSQMTGTGSQDVSEVTDMGRTDKKLSGITMVVDKVALTIVHELSDTEENFPLLQGSIIFNQTIIQISKLKLRVINTFEVVLSYFDAHQNSWTDFIQPVEICSFYSKKFVVEGVENSIQGVPSRFYAKLKEVSVSLSELSLDILLLVISKLDLAGPYAVKSSVVLDNCCKVTNQSGMTLVCQFYDNQDASVSARQLTTVRLRHLALANQPPEASFFSVQLFQKGSLSTSPIHLSLSESCQFAWRTRIVGDSKSFPGPFVAVEVSKGSEDGLSIIVSPLLRIHNETDFSLELRFHRPQHEETESASLRLNAGDIVDDAMMAFTAVDLSGGLRKALTSLSVGNYVFSFRPDLSDGMKNFEESSVGWSDDLKGGKPVRLSGLFDKLSFQVRKVLSINTVKSTLNSASCAVRSKEGYDASMYFLIKTIGKAMPVVNPDNFGYVPGNKNSPVAMQEQKEIFVLPTVQVSNLLHTEIHVSLTDRDPQGTNGTNGNRNAWNQATISCGAAANFYANPTTIYFVVTLTSFGLSCKPVNSSDWVRKLQKQKDDVSHLDIELEFGGGKCFTMLRLSLGHSGTLQAGVFTSYALQNNTNVQMFCCSANQKTLSRVDMERFGPDTPPESGSCLPPNSITSWFLKSHKLRLRLWDEKAVETQLDLDVLSGLTEIDLETEELFGLKTVTRLGVSLKALHTKEISSQIVSFSPRYVVCNQSEDAIAIRQSNMEDTEELITINSKQRIALKLYSVSRYKKETNIVEHILRKHTNPQSDLTFFIQFRPNETGFGWSGPVCVASLGRFFLKFQKSFEFTGNQSVSVSYKDTLSGFASVHVVEEGSTIVLHFHRPPLTNPPYRIENFLHDSPVTYYQKGSSEPETLGAGVTANYVWDDLTLPHKLVVQLDDVHMLREINLDKVRAWKPFYRSKQTRGLGFHLPLDKKAEDQNRISYGRLIGSETVKVGYEVYAEGVTRVLRICEFADSHKVNLLPGSGRKLRLRISYFSVHLLEHAQQEIEPEEAYKYAPIIITRIERFSWDAIFNNQHKYNQIRVQSLSVDEKWVGAPFAAMLRRHQSEKSDANDCILHVAVILLPTSSSVKHVKYLSIVLQPLDLNLDEETLMKIVPFWRSSSASNAPRQQYYFDHFEIHPIKIVASFLPGDLRYSYSSTQETLRSLLHSVIKIPVIKAKTVELNGVLVTHALITLRDLSIKCAQHYSWYAMRAIYIAKGSPLLPPAFASIFDDLASSSLDVFFDPSSGLHSLPGVTLGTLKLISKLIDNKGFTGTKRYFGDLGKTLKKAGSNILFAAVTEVSDSVLKGAETNGFNGMVSGFHQGILKLAMEPSVISTAFMEGGPDRKIKLDRSPGVDELYIEGYLQAMLDTMYKQEYLRVRVVENQVILKNLPPSSSLINEIMENVKAFLASKSLLKGESSSSHSLRHIRGEREWKLGPTILTLCEHLFVSFMIRVLRKQSGKVIGRIKWREKAKEEVEDKALVPTASGEEEQQKVKLVWRWGIDEAEKIISSKEESERKGSISSQLLLKSSSQSLDKSEVLRRIRHHKAMNKVKNTLRALSRPDSDDYYSDEFHQHKWLQQGDCFTSP
ncbi:Protein of unknown function (DUF1162 [Striga hermonthica]|uniref:Vacuolar protein sorting-associated protein 13 VPS13 adaptor binding domain-containing protein n=1 Tax=Striga hermonthica TaxID=68872 RepID=A0A9N7NQR3_STRHE|nr:Protein of unknown function (DUF1162 [Striga hermonthica]